MKIGCLGWGSLVWNPKTLPVRGTWFTDGPFLPIEFARQSTDDRITLVLVSGRALVRSLWALMSVSSLDEARKALAEREETPGKNIGVWSPSSQKADEFRRLVSNWAERMALDAVVWTALPPKFKGRNGRVPSADEVISHLADLSYVKGKRAEEYIRRAPRQIDTDYRRQIEAVLNWTPLSNM